MELRWSNFFRAARHVASLAVLSALVPQAGVAAADEPLTLRINDTVARLGGQAAVVLRTYASRPIDLGQVCLRSPMLDDTDAPALLTLTGAMVWSADQDALFDVELDSTLEPPAVLLSFQSPSATINATDGPLAVLFFDVAPGAPAGAELPISLDLLRTSLIDAAGQPVVIQPVDGEVGFVAAQAPVGLEAEGDQVAIGDPLDIGASFTEHLPITRGQVGVRVPPVLSAAPYTVEIDSRFGAATWSVDDGTPGLLIVSFDAIDGLLGTVPGQFLRISVATGGAQAGTYGITLDAGTTFLVDSSGALLDLDLEADDIVLVDSGFFYGGFESGDFSDWSAVRGPAP